MVHIPHSQHGLDPEDLNSVIVGVQFCVVAIKGNDLGTLELSAIFVSLSVVVVKKVGVRVWLYNC